MKRITNILSASLFVALFASCTVITPVATSNNAIGSKTGVSETIVLFGIQLNGNYGVSDAVKNGKIKGGVSTVDQKISNFVIFQKRELIVTGE